MSLRRELVNFQPQKTMLGMGWLDLKGSGLFIVRSGRDIEDVCYAVEVFHSRLAYH